MSKIDRKIDCDVAEVATPAEPEKKKKWRNKYIHLPTGEIGYGYSTYDTQEEALKVNHKWVKRNYDIIKNGSDPFNPDFNGKRVSCVDIQYLGPVEVEP